MLKKLYRAVLDFIVWLLTCRYKIPFSVYQMGKAISCKAVKLTKTKKDDLALEYLVKIFEKNAKYLSESTKEILAKEIQNDSGVFDRLNFSYDLKSKNISAQFNQAKVLYNPKNGDVSFKWHPF